MDSGNWPDMEPSYLAKRARLWDTLKAELEAEARGKNHSNHPDAGFDETKKSKRSAEFLERMRRMEDRS